MGHVTRASTMSVFAAVLAEQPTCVGRFIMRRSQEGKEEAEDSSS